MDEQRLAFGGASSSLSRLAAVLPVSGGDVLRGVGAPHARLIGAAAADPDDDDYGCGAPKRFRVPGWEEELEYVGDRREMEEILHDVVTEERYHDQARLRSGDVVVDIGAHSGLFALFCWREALGQLRSGAPGIAKTGVGAPKGERSPAPSVRVIAVEPHPAQLRCLRRNVAHFGAGGGVTVIGAAAGDACGDALFELYPAVPSLATLAALGEEQRDRSVAAAGWVSDGLLAPEECRLPTLTFDAVLAAAEAAADPPLPPGGPIALLKVSVSGQEEAVLRGAGAAAWARVRRVVARAHGAARGRRVRDLLLARGMRCDPLVRDDPRWLAGPASDEDGVYIVRAHRSAAPARTRVPLAPPHLL